MIFLRAVETQKEVRQGEDTCVPLLVAFVFAAFVAHSSGHLAPVVQPCFVVVAALLDAGEVGSCFDSKREVEGRRNLAEHYHVLVFVLAAALALAPAVSV